MFPFENIYTSSNETGNTLKEYQKDDGNIEKSARLKSLLDYLNLSQRAFSEKIGKSPTSISQILNGTRNLTASIVWEICAAFPKANAAWLMTGEGDMFLEEKNVLEEQRAKYNLPEGAEPVTDEEMKLREEVDRLRKEVESLAEGWLREKSINDDLRKILLQVTEGGKDKDAVYSAGYSK